MPAEPDNKMDELLKAYARKRRAEAADLREPHPATRKLLQAEVARLPTPSSIRPQSWLPMLRLFWPRLALGVSLFVMLGVAAWLFLRTAEKPGHVAKFAKKFTATAPPPPPADLEPRTQEARDGPDRAPANLAVERMEENELATKPQKNSALAREEGESKLKRGVGAPTSAGDKKEEQPVALVDTLAVAERRDADGVPFDRSAVQPANKPDSAGRANFKVLTTAPEQKGAAATGALNYGHLAANSALARQVATNSRERFVQVPPGTARAVQKKSGDLAPAILASFDLEQAGEQLRVVDGDGSVYEGQVLGDGAGVAGQLAATVRVAGRSESLPGKEGHAPEPAQGLEQAAAASASLSVRSFRVSGTNRTLQLPVVLEGVLFTAAGGNGGVAPRLDPAGAPTAQAEAAPVAPSAVPTIRGPGSPQATRSLSRAVDERKKPAPPAEQTSFGFASTNLLQVHRIQGRLRVGTTKDLTIEAVPSGN